MITLCLRRMHQQSGELQNATIAANEASRIAVGTNTLTALLSMTGQLPQLSTTCYYGPGPWGG